MMVDVDEGAAVNMAYAEGFEDGQKGDNLNPFDELTQTEQWNAYERGYISGVMDGWTDGQPDEAKEWHDFDPDC